MTHETKSKDYADVVRENWTKASRASLTATAALFVMTRGAKSGANKVLETFGIDWAALNAYAVALIGVPVVVALVVWSLWWARAFAEQHKDGKWYERVATKTDLKLANGKAVTLAVMSLILFVALPLVGLGALEAKFLFGTFEYSTSGGFDCPHNCEPETGLLAHFWPAHGLPDVFATRYRYVGNLTYLPFWQPLAWLLLGIGVLVYAGTYARLLFGPRIKAIATQASPANGGA